MFLLVFCGLRPVATVALLIYAVFLCWSSWSKSPALPGIAGLVLTLAVAADANIVMQANKEVRTGRSIPSAISAGYSRP